MSCFSQLWRSSPPESPSSPSPSSPEHSRLPLSPIPSPSPSPGERGCKGRSPLCSSPGSPKPASPVECSICFNTYDNSFKTPKLLQCSHVFCLECVARLSAALPAEPPAEPLLPCPLCRQLTCVPAQGAPALRTCGALLATLPPELQRERPLWMDGTRLCCGPADDPEGCVAIDVAMSKEESAEAAAQGLTARLARCELCEDWRRVVLLAALLVIVFCIILWPVQCALKTGNLRCLARTAALGRPELLPPKVTPAATAAPGTRPPFP